ncbi:MAG: hypothetical protein M2R45_02761 [Verrucomicrobia subdivision 3 bacterium]|nr:hypothetical protein [Limisphaerales bacterium]MCS1414310.1 hypothetical protein [Limisphaerales bacterium]
MAQNFLEGGGCFGIILFEWFQVVGGSDRFNQFPTQADCVRPSGAARWGRGFHHSQSAVASVVFGRLAHLERQEGLAVSPI